MRTRPVLLLFLAVMQLLSADSSMRNYNSASTSRGRTGYHAAGNLGRELRSTNVVADRKRSRDREFNKMLRHRVVIVGGGFGGLSCAQQLSRQKLELILLDRRNYHLFQPLLYQVATGELSPANIASPLRAIFRSRKQCTVLMGEVTGFDVSQRKVLLRDGQLPYDTLVVAAGATDHYFGNDHWRKHAPGLKSLEQALEIRRRLLYAFEAAEAEEFQEQREAWLTFVIVGSGPTGVELAGTLSEIAHNMLKHEFRRINPDETRIYLVEAGPRPLGMYPESLSERARRDLEQLRIIVQTSSRVTDITAAAVTVEHEGKVLTIPTRTVVWAAGVAASPLGKKLAEAAELELDRMGRVMVQQDLTVPGHPEIFVIGDLAHLAGENGKPLPGLAPVAMQQGAYVARLIRSRLQGSTGEPVRFRYRDRGSMAVIGRYKAIAVVGKRELTGFLAWLVWLFIHLMEITQFRNRLLVLMQWGWTYFTHDRSARLITGEDPLIMKIQDAAETPLPILPVQPISPQAPADPKVVRTP